MSTTQTGPADAPLALERGLHISVRAGTGTGPTKLAAFDAALRAAGIADRNLIRLSSIIPPGARVERGSAAVECPGGWGDRLFVVLAEERVESPHEEAWAGVGWRQDLRTRAGVFVEHEGHSRHQVEGDLSATLASISAARPDHHWGEPEVAITGIICEEEPVCALVVATFEHDPWRGSVIDVRDR